MNTPQKTIYVISGPLGSGKTSISKEISKLQKNVEVIEGDIFFLSLESAKDISWEKRIELSLQNIVETTRKYIDNSSVVIDFATDVGPDWFLKQFIDLRVQIKYVILLTDEQTLANRLAQRDDLKYLPRSLALLEKLKANEKNNQYLFDVTSKTVEIIAQEIVRSERFVIK